MTLVGQCLLNSLAQTEHVACDQCYVGEEELLKLSGTHRHGTVGQEVYTWPRHWGQYQWLM